MVFIPASIFKDPAKGKMVLDGIALVDKIVIEDPSKNVLKKFNEMRKKALLIKSNKEHVLSDFSSSSIESILKSFAKSQEFYKSDLPNLLKAYKNYQSSGNSLENRFSNSKKNTFKGIGVFGNGELPKNFRQENKDLLEIEETVKSIDKWNITNENLLKQSISNLIFWQSINFSQLPIGTPTQVISAIIQLTNCDKPKSSSGYTYDKSITGSGLISKRPECVGLQYLLEGSKFDIENSSLNGKKKFLDSVFRRFFYNNSSSGKQIMLKVGAGKAETGASNTGFELTTSSDTELMNSGFFTQLENLLDKKTMTEDDSKKAKFGAIMLIYSMFLSYISYIYHLYEILISTIKNEELKLSYVSARKEAVTNLIGLTNFAIKNFFKIKTDADIKTFIVASIEDEDKNGNILGGPGKPSSGTADKYNIKFTSIEPVLLALKPSEISRKIIIGFKDTSIYEKILDNIGDVDDDAFTRDKYPIVFSSRTSPSDFDVRIDYVETIKRLAPFLLMDTKDNVPKYGDGSLITCGAPFQNEDILDETAEALEGWYKSVYESKTLYLDYMDQKLRIFSAGIPSVEIRELKDLIFKHLRRIGTTMATTTQKDLECIELVNKLVSKYRDYRKQEIKLLDKKTITSNNKFRNLGNKPEDFPKLDARDLKRLHMGVKAVLLVEITKLCYKLFQEKNPGLTLCSNFEEEFNKRISDIDNKMKDKVQSIYTKRLIEIEKKYGKNAIKSSPSSLSVIDIISLPPAPEQYTRDLWKHISSSSPIPGTSMTISSGISSSSGLNLTYDQKNKVENDLFWRNLFTAFNSRLLFLPVIKPSSSFDDGNFYLMDLIGSMAEGRIFIMNFGADFKFIVKYLFQRGYILFTSNSSDLDNPSDWRALNFDSLEKTIKKSDGKFKNIKEARDVFFNIIGNDNFFNKVMTEKLPTNSRTSKIIQSFCKDIRKTNRMSKCDIIISRNYFGNTVAPNMFKFEGTRGIDLSSGMIYAEYKVLGNVRNIVVRT